MCQRGNTVGRGTERALLAAIVAIVHDQGWDLHLSE